MRADGRPSAAGRRSARDPQPRRGPAFRWAVGIAAALAVVLVVAGGVAFADSVMNGSRIYQGISIGEVDVSGMTVEEATQAVEDCYGPSVSSGHGIIFANEEVAASIDVDTALTEEEAQAEQLSVEEARENKKLWIADADALGAYVPAGDLAAAAFAIGRDGGLSERLAAASDGVTIPVTLAFNGDAIEVLATQIDEVLGDPRVEYGIQVEDGVASVTEGHAGTIVDRNDFMGRLEEGFLGPDPSNFSFIAEVSYAPLRVDAEGAQQACDLVQEVLDRGVAFRFDEQSWDLDAEELGPWVRAEVRETNGVARLVPYFDEKKARNDLLKRVRETGYTPSVSVTFQEEGDQIWVNAQAGSRYPVVAEAIEAADASLFGTFAATGSLELPEEEASFAIPWGEAPSRSTFDEALEIGLIQKISSFTTEYNDGAGTANRRHNIHLAADLLNNSIVPANGGVWSFIETMGGQANEELGFKGAHMIRDGEYVDAIGGGICQVATTVFNAAYEAGYPIVQRRNHSLYISSYPTGRDAAIAYPDLDLKWENDGSSDVLVRTSYTDSSLTVTLYGIDPGYVVTTETGEWMKGDAYKTKTKVDESEKEGTRYVKTKGADGRAITVHRIVSDRTGNVLHEEDFKSYYSPIDEVIITGPSTPEVREEEPAEPAAPAEEAEDKEEDGVLSTGD